MKKLFALLLTFVSILSLPVKVAAAEPSYDEEKLTEISSALSDAMWNDYLAMGGDGLPYECWCLLDTPGGVPILIRDNSNGQNGIEAFSCRESQQIGQQFVLAKGSFTVYFWDSDQNQVNTLDIRSNSLYLSRDGSNRYLVTAETYGSTETYTWYGYPNNSSGTFQACKTITMTYIGAEPIELAVIDSNGRREVSDDWWFSWLELTGDLDKTSALVFTTHS